ncbi:hypothetical protein PHMEG_00017652 [Phytophthora megakarya]|uniref:Uncharacterized protein n=1 Tax=Phytophthora megakarya TaxID=4795 RepID=A0A225VVZ0_9STRA|nr:hypothetical protein PHMEG_00017652 [Phytophthora megakarya]
MTKFRFMKEQLVQLGRAIALKGITTKEGTRATVVEGLCVVLYRLAVPLRWVDMEETFGRHSCGLSNMFLHVLQLLDKHFGGNSVSDYIDLSPPSLHEYLSQC